MIPKPLIAILASAALTFLAAPPAVAQSMASPIAGPSEVTPPPARHARRIVINPRPLLYRRCTDWYELQNRPRGQVLYPQMRCWWVRG
jgi:hypothetical protein